MVNIIEGFNLLIHRPLNIFKMVGYHFFLMILILFLFWLCLTYPATISLLIFIIVLKNLMIFCALEKLFISDESHSCLEILHYSLNQFKASGWKLLFLLFSSLLLIYFLSILGFHMGIAAKDFFMSTDEILEPNKDAITLMGENLTIMLVVFCGLIPIISTIRLFNHYTTAACSLGCQNAISFSFKQWKKILGCSFISSILLLILLAVLIKFIAFYTGNIFIASLCFVLILLIFNFTISLKIILDCQRLNNR